MQILLNKEAAEAQIAAFSYHRVPPTINLQASPNDGMLGTDEHSHYFRVGLGALVAIQSIAKLWANPEFVNILDFGCGHGRVLRWLRAAYPNSNIVGTDTDVDGVEFCAKEFNSIPHVSKVEIDKIEFDRTFDLIFAGSVATHLDESKTRLLVNKFGEWLNPGGIAVFSSHGSTAVRIAMNGGFDYSLGGNQASALNAYFRNSYGYTDYTESVGYGVSFVKPDWFVSALSASSAVDIFAIIERGWDHHHDLIAFRKK